jgi:inorganic pyrophosphatase
MTNLTRLPAFVDDDTFHVVVESPRGSGVKLKHDAKTNTMGVSRPLPLGTVFPFDWGFVPSTVGPDGDPVDAIVIWDASTFPGVVIECKAAGLIQVEQNRTGGVRKNRIRNDRVLAVPTSDKRSGPGRRLVLDRRIRAEISNFLVAVTALEGKDIEVLGWAGADAALTYVAGSRTPQRKRARG